MSVVVWPCYKAQLAVLLGSDCDGLCAAWRDSSPDPVRTGVPPRYYLPLAGVRLDLLRPSATQSHCAYQGTASYWTLDTGTAVHEDFAWICRSPLAESQKIAGLACFCNEKIDLYLDGVLQQWPHTRFS